MPCANLLNSSSLKHYLTETLPQREVDKKRLDRMGGRKPDGSVKKEAQADSTLLRMKMSAKKCFSKN